jgi:PIN domain nuclease of toxin-antitoxin system
LVRLLLDTHIALWAVIDQQRLTPGAAAMIVDPDNDVRVSIVSLWEIAIKNSLPARRRGVGISAAEALELFVATRLALHPLEARHVTTLETLHLSEGDPFDRLLLAQAMADGMIFMTHDAQIARFGGESVLFV